MTKFEYGPDRLLSTHHPTEGRAYYLFDALGSVVDLTTSGGALLAILLGSRTKKTRRGRRRSLGRFGGERRLRD